MQLNPVSKVFAGLEDLGCGQGDVIRLVQQLEGSLGDRTRLHLGDLPAQLGVLAGAAVDPGSEDVRFVLEPPGGCSKGS